MYQVAPVRVFALGTLSIVFGLLSYRKKRVRLARWIRVAAVVDNVRRDRDGNVKATFKYADEKGERRMCILTVADAQSLGLGSELQVAYNPDMPDQAFICDAKDMNFTLVVSLVFGFVLIGVGIFVLNSGPRLDRF